MPTLSAGTTQTLQSSQNGTVFTISVNGGSSASYSGAQSGSIGPIPDRRTLVLNDGETITVSVLTGEAQLTYNEAAASVVTRLDASRNVTAMDDGQRYYATTAITITIPAGLNPRPEFSVLPPPTGNLSIAFSGGATGNGAATTITRTRAANPAGIVITPYPDVTDGYGVSGA